MFWFWFWFNWALMALMLVVDVGWWVVALRLVKKRLWRIVVSVFMAGQLAAHISAIAGVEWPRHGPTLVVVGVIVWHYFAVAALLPLGIVCTCVWAARRHARVKRTGQGPPAAPPPAANSQTRREFIGTAAALAPALFTIGLTGAAWAQLNTLRLRRFTLSIPSLPPALDGITIAHLTDIHLGILTCERALRKMVNMTNALRADLVLLTGDLINYELADLSEGIALVKALEGRCGLWMIEGNHDLFEDAGEFERRVKAAGIPLLLDESVVTQVRGHPVQLFGLRWMYGSTRAWGGGPDGVVTAQMRPLLRQRQPDAFPILLTHHPHAFDAAVAADLPLTLAGHTHGGQWMLGGRRGLGPALFRYWSGLYTRGRSQMIVANGVGNVFPIRVNAPAEIVHLTLRCAGARK